MMNVRFSLFLGITLSVGSLAAKAEWHTDFEATKEIAVREKKDLLLDFTGTDWCAWCIRLSKDVRMCFSNRPSRPMRFAANAASAFGAGRWKEASTEYRELLELALERKAGRFDREKAEARHGRTGDGRMLAREPSLGRMPAGRVRYFTDGAVIGSRGFVDEFFREARDRFGPRRRSGARKLRGTGAAAAGTLWSARDLRVNVSPFLSPRMPAGPLASPPCPAQRSPARAARARPAAHRIRNLSLRRTAPEKGQKRGLIFLSPGGATSRLFLSTLVICLPLGL